MRKIATDANPLAKSIEIGAISASRLVVEAEMGVDEVANGPARAAIQLESGQTFARRNPAARYRHRSSGWT